MTGFLGLTLGPVMSNYCKSLPNGSQVIMTALGTTAAAFLGLSLFAVMSERDFSFLGGFLLVGVPRCGRAGLIACFLHLSALSLVGSGLFVILISGLILWQTSAIVHGGETNYILATTTLYVEHLQHVPEPAAAARRGVVGRLIASAKCKPEGRCQRSALFFVRIVRREESAGFDRLHACHVWQQHIRNRDAAIGLLVVLHHRDQRTPHRHS